MNDKPRVLMIITLDTKSAEALFLRTQLEQAGVQVIHMDPSIRHEVELGAQIRPADIARAAGKTLAQIRDLKHEGKCQAVMIQGALQCALEEHQRQPIHGIIGVGGSMGSSLGSAIMQVFPYGMPKVLVSTMASGFTKSFVGTKDIAMFNSVCDISGLNSIIRDVLTNAAAATAAMAKTYQHRTPQTKHQPLIAMGTLSTTDACTVRVRKALEKKGYEVMVFHTQGTGGMALDQIVLERDVSAVVDTSLVEHNDFLNNGLFNAGALRSVAALSKGIPVIFAPGNVDFMVGGPIEQAKLQFPGKRYHMHNHAVTAIRTEEQELRLLAQHLGKLIGDHAKGHVSFFIPLKGFSHHDSPDGHLHDPSLCPVFAQAVKQYMPHSVEIREFDCHLNDAPFADAIIAQVLAQTSPPSSLVISHQ